MKKTSELSSNLLRIIATLMVFLLHARSKIEKIGDLNEPLSWISRFPAWAGVWIFLFLSGFSIGIGFFSGRFSIKKCWADFYIGRFLRIAPLYFFYVIVYCIFSQNTYFIENPNDFLRMFTFNFNGNNCPNSTGHLWYISTAMVLYLLMPLIFIVVKFISSKKWTLYLSLVLTSILGISLRLLLAKNGYDWYSVIYTNPFMNIDLVMLGMFIAKIKTEGFELKPCIFKTIAHLFGFALLLLLILFNCRIYSENSSNYLNVYRLVLPTIYALVSSLIIITSPENTPEFITNISGKLSGWSYAFYIVHIAVFHYVKAALEKTVYAKATPTAQYFWFILISLIITLLISVPLSNVGTKIRESYKKAKQKKSARIAIKTIFAVFLAVSLFGGIYVAISTPKAHEKSDKSISLPGKGTYNNPYIISSAEDINLLAEKVNSGSSMKGVYFVQTCDIDFTGREFTTIGLFSQNRSFDGIYDGRGHIITNLTVKTVGNNAFFGYLGGTVMNLGFESGTVTGACVGSISSHASSLSATIVNCYTKMTVTGSRAGGIADNFNGTIANCWSDCSLISESKVGGIVSYSVAATKNCFSFESVGRSKIMPNSTYYVNNKVEQAKDIVVSVLNSGIYSIANFAGVKYGDLITWKYENGTIKFTGENARFESEYSLNFTKALFVKYFPYLIIITVLALVGVFLILGKDLNRASKKPSLDQ